MELADKFALLLLGFSFLVQLTRRRILDGYLRVVWFAGIAGIFGSAFWASYAVYRDWSGSSLGVFFLPPYRSIDYFVDYAGQRILLPWVVALLAAVVAMKIAELGNYWCRGRFFEEEELWLVGIGVFLTGYPGFLFYLPLVLIAGLSMTLVSLLRRGGRTPLYYVWLPLALFAIILKTWLLLSTPLLNGFIL